MTRIFVDTSFSIALVNEDDIDHRKAYELASRHFTFPAITTDCVLLEIGNSLARNYRPYATDTINEFLSFDEVEVVHLYPDLFHREFELSVAASIKLGVG